MLSARRACLILTGAAFVMLLGYRHGSRPPPPVKIVLYWTPMFDRADFYLGTGHSIFETCAVRNCRATTDRSEMAVERYDAVIFHGAEAARGRGVPGKRAPGQVYVYGNMESPAYTAGDVATLAGGFFNWTMTYRSDSDIYRPYGRFFKQNTAYKLPTVQHVRNKTKKIAWPVSNCRPPSKREQLYKKLKKFIPIDVYGKCGEFVCPKNETTRCWKLIENTYKFYLSFENSFCQEYVTEKLFMALQHDVVPIVYGAADYDTVAPPHSVIDVTKFETIDALAAYIKLLDENPEKYLEYFKWKQNYEISISSIPVLCDLCAKLNSISEENTKVYSDINEWWIGKTVPVCKTGNDLPEIVHS